MDVCPYAGIVTGKKAEPTLRRHIVAHNDLRRAILIRILKDGRGRYFILEDVATSERRRFDSVEALLVWLREVFLAG